MLYMTPVFKKGAYAQAGLVTVKKLFVTTLQKQRVPFFLQFFMTFLVVINQ